MISILLRLVLWLGLLLTPGLAAAHESRPAYLEVNEIVPGRYTILWRTPLNAGGRLPVKLQLPEGVRELSPPIVRQLSDSRIERRLVEVPGGLAGKRVLFVGLQGTLTDVLVRVQLANSAQSSFLVHPSDAWVEIPRTPGSFAVAKTYVALGVEHILTGFDHLCFVLGLILIVGFNRRLVWTITAFTGAHSISLALATLGVINFPGPPVEATIALSIAFLASEIIQRNRGQEGVVFKRPWVVAFAFGLLHGLGFAGALAEIGLPANSIPLALLFFNLGVEIGQLLFIAAAFAATRLLRALAPKHLEYRPVTVAAAYLIGVVSCYWVIERAYSFWP